MGDLSGNPFSDLAPNAGPAGVDGAGARRRALNLSDEGDYLPVTQNLVDSLDFWFVILSHPEEDQLMRDVAAVRELERRLVAGEPAARLG
jgi:hypothetical protein